MTKKRGDTNHNREKIIKENLRGFTVSELSKKTSISRQIVANCFVFLEGAKKVKIRQTGIAKIYFWTKKEKQNE